MGNEIPPIKKFGKKKNSTTLIQRISFGISKFKVYFKLNFVQKIF